LAGLVAPGRFSASVALLLVSWAPVFGAALARTSDENGPAVSALLPASGSRIRKR